MLAELVHRDHSVFIPYVTELDIKNNILKAQAKIKLIERNPAWNSLDSNHPLRKEMDEVKRDFTRIANENGYDYMLYNM